LVEKIISEGGENVRDGKLVRKAVADVAAVFQMTALTQLYEKSRNAIQWAKKNLDQPLSTLVLIHLI
jgi:hypothetical protein